MAGSSVGAFAGVGLAGVTARMLIAALVSSGAGLLVLTTTSSLAEGSFALSSVLGAVSVSAGVGAVMLVVYFAVIALLGVEESWTAWRAVAKAFKGIRRR
mgnify:CR=1 FL=1